MHKIFAKVKNEELHPILAETYARERNLENAATSEVLRFFAPAHPQKKFPQNLPPAIATAPMLATPTGISAAHPKSTMEPPKIKTEQYLTLFV